MSFRLQMILTCPGALVLRWLQPKGQVPGRSSGQAPGRPRCIPCPSVIVMQKPSLLSVHGCTALKLL